MLYITNWPKFMVGLLLFFIGSTVLTSTDLALHGKLDWFLNNGPTIWHGMQIVLVIAGLWFGWLCYKGAQREGSWNALTTAPTFLLIGGSLWLLTIPLSTLHEKGPEVECWICIFLGLLTLGGTVDKR